MRAEVSLQRKPARAKGVIITEEPGGVLTVLNPISGKTFVINDVAKLILSLCDGRYGVEDIVEAVLREFAGTEREQVTNDTLDFLRMCEEAGMIAWNR
jgi:hypothetical protein